MDLYGLTYGSLIDFADAARASNVDRDAPVTQVMVENNDDMVDKFELNVGHLPAGHVTFDAAAATTFAAELDSILEGEGDARGHLESLRALRDHLLKIS